MSASPAKTGGDRLLDFAGAAEVLTDLGVTKRNGGKVDEQTVREWADAGKLPFFKSPSGVRMIWRSVLVAYFETAQRDAVGRQKANLTGRQKSRRRA